ncbi:MAG: alpha/beta hydrolase [Bacillota bacterium]|nr:alpha/beta hydrolase [Bacillota bacterium]
MIIEIDGVKLNYKVSGKGKNVVLLHGWGCSIQTFAPVHNYLEKNFCTYSIDFPGFGESDDPPEPWSIYDYADFVSKFLDKLNIEDPILIGHSFGGRVSIIISSQRKVNKIILTGSAGVKPKRSPMYYIKVYSYKAFKNILRLPILNKHREEILEKYRKKVGSSDYKALTGVMQRTFVKVVNEDLQHLMPKIKASTLLIWGENDTATPVSDGRIMEKKIPDAGLVVLKNAGHYAYLDKFNQFIAIITSFLKNDMEESRE